jgi:hypothetical protein
MAVLRVLTYVHPRQIFREAIKESRKVGAVVNLIIYGMNDMNLEFTVYFSETL